MWAMIRRTVVAVVLTASPAASAQVLDLGPGDADSPITWTFAEELAARLEREAAALRAGATGPVNDAAAELRELAVLLLRVEGLSANIERLTGARLAAAMQLFDAQLRSAPPGAAGAIARTARGVAAQRGGAAFDLALRDLAYALAAAGGADPPCAWPPPRGEAGDVQAIDHLEVAVLERAQQGDAIIPPEAIASLRLAARRPALRPAAVEAAKWLVDALECDAPVNAAEWIAIEQRESFARRRVEAIELLLRPGTRAQGRELCDGLTAWGRLIASIDTLEAAGGDVRAARAAAAEAFVQLWPARAGRPDGQAIRAIGAMERAIRSAAERRTLPDDREMSRDLRGGWRRAVLAAARPESDTLALLGELAANPATLRDPAAAAKLARHREAMAGLHALRRMPDVQQTLEASGWPEATAAAERLGALARDLRDDRRAADAAAELTRLIHELEQIAPVESGASATDDFSPLVDALASRRLVEHRAWLAAIGAAQGDTAARRALRGVDEALSLVVDVRALRAAAGDEVISSWGGWIVPPASLEAFAPGLAEIARATAQAALGGRTEQALALVAEANARHAPARLVALMWRTVGVDRVEASAIERALAPLAAPPSHGAWLGGHRRELAELSLLWLEREAMVARFTAGVIDEVDRRIEALAGAILADADVAAAPGAAR